MRNQGNRKNPIRCAVYTRKSSEEGLEQDFNSLDAQREACEAYITSQKHEGWMIVSERYDDGGLSGATMERPALKRLLADITADKIDSVIVYKVDRLSRSLSDFVRMIEIFDTGKVSFVSVTQQFNTTTSMGRLTLNMLLSFAQFEREVTGERIRDKIAASKKKGMWMGGLPPLGYDVRDRKLVINPAEADTVCHIYRRYLQLGSVRLLKEDLTRDGLVSKLRVTQHGRKSGGRPFARGALYLMLSNPLYQGKIVHKNQCYPGRHEPILCADLWHDVQTLLTTNRVKRRSRIPAGNPALLAGLLFDEDGERMTPVHTRKKGRAYRYYVSGTLLTGAGKKGRRLPAGDIEGLPVRYLLQLLREPETLYQMTEPYVRTLPERKSLMVAASQLAAGWPRSGSAVKRRILRRLIARMDIGPGSVALQIRPQQLPVILGAEHTPVPCSEPSDLLTIRIPAKLKRAGLEMKFAIEGDHALAGRHPDPHLQRLIGKAHVFRAIFLRGGQSIAGMAGEAGVSSSYFTRILRLSFLAPDFTRAILAGRQPVQLTARRLKSCSVIPVSWDEQKSLFAWT